ncbi:hypothetical protein EDF88_3912 [Buttiauxella sp. BIGb0552]|uniref:hypothetical protein n=1 Tax=Buttiauxella sp. BIGb0552 TaxID=2485120 RepID=UPI0010669C5C|nr:hypothetical protein [Buttiauxella sp. BIGb0552]TDX14595.1 hypothetical protein EDF88_3912 [Buttiauxella sp. BIGb0552]
MKLNIEISGKYVVTGTANDLVLREKVIIKTGDNAGNETLSAPRYYSKFEHLVKELCHREILISDAQTLQALVLHIENLSQTVSKSISEFVEREHAQQSV